MMGFYLPVGTEVLFRLQADHVCAGGKALNCVLPISSFQICLYWWPPHHPPDQQQIIYVGLCPHILLLSISSSKALWVEGWFFFSMLQFFLVIELWVILRNVLWLSWQTWVCIQLILKHLNLIWIRFAKFACSKILKYISKIDLGSALSRTVGTKKKKRKRIWERQGERFLAFVMVLVSSYLDIRKHWTDKSPMR